MTRLSIDLETYSSRDIKKVGTYAYVDAADFEILLFGFAFDDDPVQVIDLAQGEMLPADVLRAIFSPEVLKTAYNANFEMTCLAKYFGEEIDVKQWACTSVLALTLGLPGYLAGVAQAMAFPDDKQKMSVGRRLIEYFCKPCKPTKSNGGRLRNLPQHDGEKWELFKQYCGQDVDVERNVLNKLSRFRPSEKEQRLWELDQKIISTGILIDRPLVENAIKCDEQIKAKGVQQLKEITGLDNPNSVAQLKNWLGQELGTEVPSLTKGVAQEMLQSDLPASIKRILELKLLISKTSVKKYSAMIGAACSDDKIRGLLQFYGANRTGRWAGRIVQVHNLPQNHLPDLDDARNLVRNGDFDMLELLYPNASDVLSQLIRTALIASPGKTFIVADFSAIEARVIAWLAGERWRQEVFATTGKIYEASASKMFHVPIEEVTKGSTLRQKGKVAELALGYQGGVGALKQMGADKMGLADDELADIVAKWRKASPKIVQFWWDVEAAVKEAISKWTSVQYKHGIAFQFEAGMLFIRLPSGRRIAYAKPRLEENNMGRTSITYLGVNQTNKSWCRLETYGGKLVENIVQATARDCLAESMLKLDAAGYKILMHVHDEVIIEAAPAVGELERVIKIMSENVSWNRGLKLDADGYVTPYYRKD